MATFKRVHLTVSSVDELIDALRKLPFNVKSVFANIDPTPQSGSDPDLIPEPTPVYSIAEVRAALAKVRDAQGVDGMREILRNHGVEKLADLDPKHYAAVMQEAQDAC